MQTRDYLNIGLKLIGVYFAVLGVTVLALTLITLGIEFVTNAVHSDATDYFGTGATFTVISAMQPIAYLVCGFVLTRRTGWCLDLIGYPPSDT